MCHAYIPKSALEPDPERKLANRVSNILVSYEARRVIDLMNDFGDVKAVYERAAAISGPLMHRTDSDVDGRPVHAPVYRLIANVPKGQVDDKFVPAINETSCERWSRPSAERRRI